MFGLYSEKTREYVWNVNTDGNVGIKTRPSASDALSVNGEMKVSGSASVECLTVRGCDIFETYNAKETIPAGYVVAIDPDGPVNSVRLNAKAYDHGIVSVVSGGGVIPGVGLI